MPVNIGDNRIIPDGIAHVRPEDAERLSRHLLKEGDIVYSRRGDVERRALVRAPEAGWLCGTGCLRIHFSQDGVDPVFASFYLSHPEVRAWIVRHAVGATMPNLNTAILEAVPFALPPLHEQLQIARILAPLEDKVDLNRRMNQTMEAMARAIFKSWFVDFDLMREEEGWEPGFLLDMLDVIGGGTPKTTVRDFWDGDIPWFSVADTPPSSDVFVINTAKKITRAGLDNSVAKLLPVGTTILSARGTVGNLALTSVPMAMNQSCYGLMGKQGYGSFFTYFTARQLVDTLQQRAHGSVFDTITRDTLAGVRVLIPPVQLAAEFDRTVEPFLSRILKNLYESHALAALRDTLLPKLLSGEIRIKQAEKIMDKAV
jgi:type I restriction enzyme S subunit